MTIHPETSSPSIAWLLDNPLPGVRYLALRDLLRLPDDDPELQAARLLAHTQGPIAGILAQMHPDGYWAEPGSGYLPKYRSSVWSLITLAQLGARIELDERIGRAVDYILEEALNPAGQISTNGAPSGTADCLQGNLCWALLELGIEPKRLEAAFDWLARTVTGEGIASRHEKDAPLRYYAGKCGPLFACGANNNLSCAWGGVKALLALGRLPPDPPHPAGRTRHPGWGGFLPGDRPRHRRLPQRLGRETQRQLVEVRLSRLLRHRPAADWSKPCRAPAAPATPVWKTPWR